MSLSICSIEARRPARPHAAIDKIGTTRTTLTTAYCIKQYEPVYFD